MKLGAAFLPLDPRAPMERSMSIIRDHGIRVVVCSHTHTQALKSMDLEGIYHLFLPLALPFISSAGILTAIVPRHSFNEELADVDFSMHDSHPDDVCYNIFTSGSTGKPKGVLVPHRGVSYTFSLYFLHVVLFLLLFTFSLFNLT